MPPRSHDNHQELEEADSNSLEAPPAIQTDFDSGISEDNKLELFEVDIGVSDIAREDAETNDDRAFRPDEPISLEEKTEIAINMDCPELIQNKEQTGNCVNASNATSESISLDSQKAGCAPDTESEDIFIMVEESVNNVPSERKKEHKSLCLKNKVREYVCRHESCEHLISNA